MKNIKAFGPYSWKALALNPLRCDICRYIVWESRVVLLSYIYLWSLPVSSFSFTDAPTCQSELLSGTDGGAIIIAASRSEDVNISCEMDALPNSLKFHWTHTNTVGESSEIGSEIYSSLGSRSLLHYHVRSEEDFGTLLCWASNSIGTAERPCVYQLVPAGWFLSLPPSSQFLCKLYFMLIVGEWQGIRLDFVQISSRINFSMYLVWLENLTHFITTGIGIIRIKLCVKLFKKFAYSFNFKNQNFWNVLFGIWKVSRLKKIPGNFYIKVIFQGKFSFAYSIPVRDWECWLKV